MHAVNSQNYLLKLTIGENLDPRKFSTIWYHVSLAIPKNVIHPHQAVMYIIMVLAAVH